MTHKELDRIDLKILDALQRAARTTNQNLAQMVALSPSACLARVHTLQSAGLITGYHARVALARIRPVMMVCVQISIREHVTTAFRHFEALVSGIPEIVEVLRVSGPFDYLLKAVVSDMEEWKEISQGLLNQRHGVDKLMSVIVMEEVKPYVGVPIRASSTVERRLPGVGKLVVAKEGAASD